MMAATGGKKSALASSKVPPARFAEITANDALRSQKQTRRHARSSFLASTGVLFAADPAASGAR
jgi:hypothetical protein